MDATNIPTSVVLHDVTIESFSITITNNVPNHSPTINWIALI